MARNLGFRIGWWAATRAIKNCCIEIEFEELLP